jgi:Caspase domain
LGKRLGLIIGINNYQDTAFQQLHYAENDARALVQWLANNRGGNWNPSDLQLLLGAQATPELTETLTNQLCLHMAEQSDLFFLYFAGHVFLDEIHAEGYLAFANTGYKHLTNGLSIHSLVDKVMLRSQAAQVVIVLDCFQTGTTWSRRRNSPFDFKPLIGPTLQNTLQQTQGRLLCCSCRGNEYAPESGNKNLGNLLYHMVVGLSGPATDPISGQTTLQNLHAFLSSSLDEQHRPQVFGQEQRPIVLVGEMPPLINRQENISNSTSHAPYAPRVSLSMSNQPAEYLNQSSVGIASAQMSPSTSGQLTIDTLEQNRKRQCMMMLSQAQQQFQMQNTPGALSTIEYILQLAPDYIDALILKGQLLGTIGLFQDALPIASQVVQLDPNNALGWSMCATILANMGQLQEASAAIERSIALNPINAEALAIREMLLTSLARNSLLEQDARSRSAIIPTGKNDGVRSILIGAIIQIMALCIGAIGASMLIVKPQLPIMVAILLESIALAILCVNAARGAYLYGIQRFLVTFVISLVAIGILGGIYRFGYYWFAHKVIAFPPLIVPVLFLGFWLVAATILPILAAMGGLMSRITFGRRQRQQ